jgi:hypothetical protein
VFLKHTFYVLEFLYLRKKTNLVRFALSMEKRSVYFRSPNFRSERYILTWFCETLLQKYAFATKNDLMMQHVSKTRDDSRFFLLGLLNN